MGSKICEEEEEEERNVRMEKGSEVGRLMEKQRRSFSPRRKRRGDTREPVAWNAGQRTEKMDRKDTLKVETEESIFPRRRCKKLKVKKQKRRRRRRRRRRSRSYRRCLSSEEWTERQTGVSQSYGSRLGS